MRTFKDIVEEYKKVNTVDNELLPICHTTKYRTLLKHIISNNNQLVAHKSCAYHDDEKLIFLFYGKSSYYPPEDQVDKYKDDPPVTLIYLKIFDDEEIKRLCCFDSGAFINGRFNFSNPGVAEAFKSLLTFLVEKPTPSDIIAGVNALYSNQENYLKSNYKTIYNLKKFPYSLCLVTLDDINNNKKSLKSEYGPQAFTFEIQIENEVKSQPDLVFFPQYLAKDEDVIEGWAKYFPNSKIETYDFDEFDEINVAYSNMRKSIINYSKTFLK